MPLHTHPVWRLHNTHPRLLVGFALACAVGLFLPNLGVSAPTTRVLMAWCVGTCSYLALVTHMVLKSTPELLRRRARVQAESRAVTVTLVTLATFAGLAAIVAQLSYIKGLPEDDKLVHVLLVILTIFSSWAFTNTMFALQYAHDYFDAAHNKRPGGLEFAGTDALEYGDFVYCAFIIGTSGQTADVIFSSKTMRRLGMVHCVLAFVFNTVVLAMTINIAASFI